MTRTRLSFAMVRRVYQRPRRAHNRRRRWLHCDAKEIAESRRFYTDDLIVKVGVTNVRTTAWRRQDRSRSAHSYFMVFRAVGRKPSQDPARRAGARLL